MQVFKLFFQIINKNKVSVFMTLFIAFAFSIIFVKSNGDQFVIQKADIAIVDKDQSESSKALIKYMAGNTNVKDIDEDMIEDALFYQDIEYVMYIPKGYEGQIKQNKEIALEKKQVPDSASAYIVDSYAESFTNTIRGYYAHGDVSIKEAVKKANKDLALEVSSENIVGEKTEPIHFYFNFLCYSFFCSLIWGIGAVMVSLNKVDIKRRNVVSPISNLKMNVQLSMGAGVLGVVLFVVSVIFAYVFFGDGMKATGSYLYILNLVALLFPCLGLSYLIGSAIKKAEAINGISNILCLGLAFLGGCFVPQSMLSDSVLMVSKFIPSYWFVNSNDRIYNLTSLDAKFVDPIFQNMAILIGFGILFFVLAILISKKTRKNVI
ncbi:ABC transporter permease [Breznakia sp. OttesenSCG-928-G09]|nr:ABC transporter permease [Breznakia sp. OttesenSCG-928-G09]